MGMTIDDFDRATGATCPRCGQETHRLIRYGISRWMVCPACAVGPMKLCVATVPGADGRMHFCSQPAMMHAGHQLLCWEHRQRGAIMSLGLP